MIRLDDLPPPPPGKSGWPWTEEAPTPVAPDDSKAFPPFGIVTPSYNQGEYLEATIRSVLLQNYPGVEYFVEDGGSTDQSPSIIERYAPFLTGWVSERDRGQGHAINKGMAKLRNAEWINWLNSDDILMPGALLAVARASRQFPDAGLIIGAGELRRLPGNERTVLRRSAMSHKAALNWPESYFCQPAAFFRRDLFNEAGGVDESLHNAMDYDLWLKLLARTHAHCLPDVLAVALYHADAKTTAARGRMYGETIAVAIRNGGWEEAISIVEKLYQTGQYYESMYRQVERLPGFKPAVDLWQWLKKHRGS